MASFYRAGRAMYVFWGDEQSVAPLGLHSFFRDRVPWAGAHGFIRSPLRG
jgi:hypothetical protein